jgi:superfamily I DNA/RNA helicase
LNILDIVPSKPQHAIINHPDKGAIFVHGPAGSGKTTASCLRLLQITKDGVDPESILILVPQRSLAQSYVEIIRSKEFPMGTVPSILTLGGLAQRTITLFWPIISQTAGFKNYKKPPKFLTLETAQFFMSSIVEPLLTKGYFAGVTIERSRLYSQILDNLNKSAVVGFLPDQIAERLSTAWAGKSSQANIYLQAQECALQFRKLCLENNLLDFSLQISLFRNHLWESFICRQYLQNQFQHLIYDNIEEDFPVAHDVINDWLSIFQSAVVISDDGGGYRSFLGADPASAGTVANTISSKLPLTESFVMEPGIYSLQESLSEILIDHRLKLKPEEHVRDVFTIKSFRFYPQTLDWVAEKINELIVDRHIPPEEISVLTPFLSDSLIFTISEIFNNSKIPTHFFRPSRSLHSEPIVKSLITLAKLAFPSWGLFPAKEDVRAAIVTTISQCDLIRADLLAQMLYSPNNLNPGFKTFDQLNIEMQNRITASVGDSFEGLRTFLKEQESQQNQELDYFFNRIFNNILSQPGFNFQTNPDAASKITNLIESCRNFRKIVSDENHTPVAQIGQTYIKLVEEGVISAQYLSDWDRVQEKPGVLIAPAFSFLMRNQPVQYQFWLDIGSQGWWTRLDQPLTQPHVLSRNWLPNDKWTDSIEFSTNQNSLSKLVTGLLQRCSRHVFLCSIGLNEQGNEERGALMVAVQNLLKSMKIAGINENV